MKTTITLLVILLLVLFMVGCENSIAPTEFNSERINSLSKKPVKPPKDNPTPTPMPALAANAKYIAGTSDGKVIIWNEASLTKIWSTSVGTANDIGISIGIGDLFNNSGKELLVARKISVGKGKKNRVESQELLVFKEGDLEPYKKILLRPYEGYRDALWDMKIADIDNDNDLEVILAFRDQIEIWESNGTDLIQASTLNYFDSMENPWEIDVNGSKITVCFAGNIWRSYGYDGGSIAETAESSAYNEFGSLNSVIVSDINYDTIDEVVGGSSVGKILIWETPNIIIATDQIIPKYYAWDLAAGELDGELSNGKEIIGVARNSGQLHLFHYDVGTLVYENPVATAFSNSLNGVIVSGNRVFLATANGLEVFEVYDNLYTSLLVDDVGALQNLIFE